METTKLQKWNPEGRTATKKQKDQNDEKKERRGVSTLVWFADVEVFEARGRLMYLCFIIRCVCVRRLHGG